MAREGRIGFREAALAAGLAPENGLQALQKRDAAVIETAPGARIVASVDVDAHFQRAEPNANRWDYGVGVRAHDLEAAFWIEPHPASSSGEVDKMLAKLEWLKRKLNTVEWADLKRLTTQAQAQGIAFRWSTTGSVRIRPGSKEALRLSKAGIDQPRTRVRLP